MKKLVLLVGLLIAFSANARDCESEANNGGMSAMRSCLIEESEKPMTAAYNYLIKILGANQDAISAIKQAQIDWEKFKVSTCNYVYTLDGLDESANCQVEFNTARAKMLNLYAKQANKQ
ncbi:MAG: hypothetical protein Q8Q54_03620 [Methylococcales bacterium]|nr:hypothetical protein [Methylococcales bacterium]MDP3837991.1 hypothetical protein [Methylococcales bacterium]